MTAARVRAQIDSRGDGENQDRDTRLSDSNTSGFRRYSPSGYYSSGLIGRRYVLVLVDRIEGTLSG